MSSKNSINSNKVNSKKYKNAENNPRLYNIENNIDVLEFYYNKFFGKRILGLGLIWSLINYGDDIVNFGQEYRDNLKGQALEVIGVSSYKTLDDKHESSNVHCNTNFNNPHDMYKQMITVWGKENCKFDYIILDHFFSPNAWARVRWSEKFFKSTLCYFVSEEILLPYGKIILPIFEVVREYIEANRNMLETIFEIECNETWCENPLWVAAEISKEDLMKVDPPLYNLNQAGYFVNYDEFPFYVLTKKRES